MMEHRDIIKYEKENEGEKKRNCSIIRLVEEKKEKKQQVSGGFFFFSSFISMVLCRSAMTTTRKKLHHLLNSSNILLLRLNKVDREVEDIIQRSYYHNRVRPFDNSELNNVSLILRKSTRKFIGNQCLSDRNSLPFQVTFVEQFGLEQISRLLHY